MDRRLTADHRQLARVLAGLVLRAATNRDEAGQPIIPPSRKALDDLKAAAWERVLKPYYVGTGTDALDGPNPRSPYALLLVTGIEQATRIQAERQAALVRRLVKDREVVRWLTGPRPMLPTREMQPTIAGRITELTLTPTRDTQAGLRGVDGRIDTERARAALVRPRGTYDAFHQWVDPNGYRLSDRIWRTGIDVRSRIDLLLDYEVARGTGAVAIANMLEPFLTPGGAAGKTVKPYGREGSYSARRLARTEITAAAGRATVNAAAANPFVAQLRWRLSASHPKIDICDDYARGGPNGDGIYDIDKLPQYPPHPHCLCSILPVPSGSTSDLVQTLRADIQAARGNLIDAASGGDPARARALQGTLSPEYLTQAMMTGNLDDAVAQAVRQAQTVRPDVPVVPVVTVTRPAGVPIKERLPEKVLGKSVYDPIKRTSVNEKVAETSQAAWESAVDTISKVHGDGELNKIEITEIRSRSTRGGFVYGESLISPERGQIARKIELSRLPEHARALKQTAIHEIGHFIDFEQIGITQSDDGKAPFPEAAKEWLDAIKKSSSYTDLVRAKIENPEYSGYVDYLLNPSELWARSYTQYVVKKSGDTGGMEMLREPDGKISMQWQDDDFKGIETAIDKMFKEKEWIE